MRPYRTEANDPKLNAQRNLSGRTHYVDDDTLRWHKSRVISARESHGGLLFSLITSDALDMNNTRRGFRYVVFDVFGNVISRPDLEHAFKTSDKARKARDEYLATVDAKAVTLEAIEKAERHHAQEMQELRDIVNKSAAA